MNHTFLTFSILYLLSIPLNDIQAAIFYSNQTGTWNTGSTWTSGTAPGVNDTVIIQNGHTVTITGSGYTHNGDITIESGGKFIVDCGNSNNGFTFDGGSFHIFGELELTFPDKDLQIVGNSLFWAHDGALIFISDDLRFEANSTNIIENVCIEVDDDLHLDGSNATICGSGGASIGTNTGANTVNFNNGATTDQICIGTGVYRGAGGSCTNAVALGSGNTEPTARADATTTDQNTATTIDVLNMGTADSDGDGDQVQLLYATGIAQSGSTANGGTASINDNGTPTNYADDFIDYVPPTGFTGDDTFDYTITDGNGGISIATVTVTVSAVLPVTLFDFSVREVNCQAQIQWATANEWDNQGFVLQKSSNGTSWYTIAQFDGAGTTNELTHYLHHDLDIQRINYYRLQQIDYDGSINYSPIIQLTSSCAERLTSNEGILSVTPNPVRYTTVKIEYKTPVAETELMILTDLSGQILQKTIIDFEAGINTLRLDLNHLPTGTYVVQIGRSQYKLVKIHD